MIRPPFRGRAAWARWLWPLGIGGYLVVVAVIGLEPLREAFASARPLWVAAMLATVTAAQWLRALKWRAALGPGASATSLYFLSRIGGAASPMRLGELAPLLLQRHRSPRVGGWIVLDRLLEMAATLGLGVAGFLAIGAGVARWFPVLLVAVAGLVLLPSWLMTRRRLLVGWARRFKPGGRPRRALQFAAAASGELRKLGWFIPAAAGWTLAVTSIDLAAGILLYRGFGHELGFLTAAAAQCAHGLTALVPVTPNATGVPYLAAAGVLHEFGGIPTAVLAAAVPVAVAANTLAVWFSAGLALSGLKPPVSESQGQVFDRLAESTCLYAYEPEVFTTLDALAPGKGRVLDIGCGDGSIGSHLTADTVVGIDLSRRCAALASGRGVRGLCADARRLPFPDAAFDTVYCVDALHHMSRDHSRAVGEFDRVTMAGGRVVIVEPDARNLFVRLTQAPWSPVRVAPCDDEPALDPREVRPLLERLGYVVECRPLHLVGVQMERSVFPMWQRLAKAPFVLALAFLYRGRPNKFALVARKPERAAPA